MIFDYTPPIDYKPTKNYTEMTALTLLQDWMALPPSNYQRFFVYLALRAKPGGFFKSDAIKQLSDVEQRKFFSKVTKEQRLFRLKETETLIYCISEMIHHPLWRLFIFLLATLPLGITLWIAIITHNYDNPFIGQTALFALLVWIIQKTRIFTSKLFISNYRLGFCLTIFSTNNFYFSAINFSNSVFLMNLETVKMTADRVRGPLFAWEILLKIWRLNDNSCQKYWIASDSGEPFIQCLAAIIRDNGDDIYIPENIWRTFKKYKNPNANLVPTESIYTGMDIKDWYKKVHQVLEGKKFQTGSKFRKCFEVVCYKLISYNFEISGTIDYQTGYHQLQRMASFMTTGNVKPYGIDYNETGNQFENRMIIAKFRCSRFDSFFERNDWIYFTNEGLLIANNEIKSIKAFYRYHNINIKCFDNYIILNYNNKLSSKINFSKPLGFPLVETLVLLGCPKPQLS